MAKVTIDFMVHIRRNRVCMLSKTGENLPVPQIGGTITYEDETFKVVTADYEYTMDDDAVHVRLYLRDVNA